MLCISWIVWWKEGAFDKVVMMENGRVVEVGEPGELMARDGGWFRGLWEGRV